MLESPGLTPGWAAKATSSNVAPTVRFARLNAYPGALGATLALAVALYAHEVQSSPPYTATPSSKAPTTTDSTYAPAVPHA
jgi:hypothetical protein